MTGAPQPGSGVRVRELRLAGVAGKGPYGVSFLDEHDEWRSLGVIAGPSHTGKTSIADFVRYLLGDDEHPLHQEIVGAVRSALLEIELDGQVTTIERAAAGQASAFASVWRKGLADLVDADELRVTTEPTSDPEGLSQLVLSGFGLDGIGLPVAPTKEGSGTQLLSIRDVFRVMFLPNHRLDNMDLTFENSNYMVRQKFRQLIDVMFGVHDPQGAQLQASTKAANDAVNAAKRAENALKDLAQADYPAGVLELQQMLDVATNEIAATSNDIAALDTIQRTNAGAISEMRARLDRAQSASSEATVRARGRVSLLARLTALRAQYADDKKKLTFLREAERLFNPLDVVTCPACMSRLATAPSLVDGVCSLCHNHVGADGGAKETQTSSPEGSSGHDLIESELQAVSRRLADLNDYWARLDADRTRLEQMRDDAEEAVERLAEALDRVVETPAPWLAERDALTSRRAQAQLEEQFAEAGLRVWQRVSDAQQRRERLEVTLRRLRAERASSKKRPDRAAVIRALSERFTAILEDFEYPKLSDTWIDDDLVPHVRGMLYTAASSGGLVLISLAYHLAIWELAFERDADAPGLLVIDSPQKNLGHGVVETDPDFADTRLVENFYRHAQRWLAGDGVGAQLIVIDNTPPNLVKDHVVVHYTRSAQIGPYGLITDAVD